MTPQIRQFLSDQYLSLNIFFEMSVKQHSSLAIKEKDNFLKIDFEKMELEDHLEYTSKLIYYSCVFSIFHDDEIKRKFEQMGFTKCEMQWFIKFSKIRDSVQLVWQTDGIDFDKEKVLHVLRNFILMKLFAQLTVWSTDHRDKEKTKRELEMAHTRLLDRINYNSPNRKKPRSLFEETLNTQFEIINQNGDAQFVNNKHRNYVTGEINKTFLAKTMRKLVRKSNLISHIDFRMAFYDLAKLVLVDFEFMTEEKRDNSEMFYGESLREVLAREVKAQFLGL